jgi:hypothetical protein
MTISIIPLFLINFYNKVFILFFRNFIFEKRSNFFFIVCISLRILSITDSISHISKAFITLRRFVSRRIYNCTEFLWLIFRRRRIFKVLFIFITFKSLPIWGFFWNVYLYFILYFNSLFIWISINYLILLLFIIHKLLPEFRFFKFN